ncbi:UTRA domain-containing protein, partial [Micromonospora palythoicola]|uniref:UTRA domain-containing protein n=1 Tax=Micromonospora palythoicola TaxID=3120507 RepID=UPI002FCDEAC2
SPAAGRREVDFPTPTLSAGHAAGGVWVARATETIRPGVLDGALAAHLDDAPGAAVLISDRTTYTLDGTAIVVDRATILGSMMQINTDRAARGLSLHWGASRDVP